LHYLTLCSGNFIRETDSSTLPPSITKYKNASSTFCTPRWLDQRVNLTQILIYAASKGLQSTQNFPPSQWNTTVLDDIRNNIAPIMALDYPWDVSPVLPAVATLITGFAFAVFASPLILVATFVAITERNIFRLLPHAAMAFAALSAIFLTASAGLLTAMGNLFSGFTPGDAKVSASTSPSFLGFEWTAAVSMWLVVFLVWLGGIWGQRVVLVNNRYHEKLSD
jgi:hypothetical protein